MEENVIQQTALSKAIVMTLPCDIDDQSSGETRNKLTHQLDAEKITALFDRLSNDLCKVVGTGSSIRSIAEDMPVTPLERNNVFCPELTFSVLGDGVIKHAHSAMSIMEELQSLLADANG